MAGLIPSSTLEQVRSASDIVDVIGAYIPLKKAGANFLALCPFHREKSPSFNVNPHRQIFHCFGCHKGGDVFRFVQEYENLNFVEAVQRLADRANIPLTMEASGGEQPARRLKDSLLQIHEAITQRWQQSLLQDAAGEAARHYLAQRRVSADAIRVFRLGFAPEAWDDTVNWARGKGYELELVEQAGLILKKENGFYDRFRGRLMFPICDEQGRVIGFSGRILTPDVKGAKYVNSPETPIFTKGRVFFGLDKARRALLDAERAIICEGQLDLIACHSAGFQNVVAPQGTALTADQARVLKRYVEEVILCFDADAAGQNAASRSLDSLLAAGLAIRVAIIPAPHDPDSFIRDQGAAAFGEIIERAQGFFDFYLNYLCQLNDPNSDRGRVNIAHEMGQALFKAGNSILIDTYAQKTALRLGVAPEAVRAAFRAPTTPSRAEAPSEAAPPAPPPPSVPEVWLLRVLLSQEVLLIYAAQHLDLRWIQHDILRALVQRLFSAHAQGQWQGVAPFISSCEDAFQAQLVTGALATDQRIESTEQSLRDLLLRLRNQCFDRELSRLKQQLAQPDLPIAQQEEALRRMTSVRQAKQQPLGSMLIPDRVHTPN